MAKLPPPVIRPATRADLVAFYGQGKLPLTARAVVGLVDGKIVGCGGVTDVDGLQMAFCDVIPEARRYKLALVKAAAAIVAEVKAEARFIFAEADPNEPGAVRWITSLGFRATARPGMFRWEARHRDWELGVSETNSPVPDQSLD
jgi:hypothetical protein